MINDTAAAAAFIVFVALALATVPSGDLGRLRRTLRVRCFIGYTLLVSFAVGGAQWDLWPFAAWPLVAAPAPRIVEHPRVVAVDAAGREHDIDARAWEPLSADELTSWIANRFPQLEADVQDRALAALLRQVEAARARAAGGESVGRYDRVLGPLTAPLFLLHPRRWTPGRAPDVPFVGLRVLSESWDVETRRADPTAVERTLVRAFPEAR